MKIGKPPIEEPAADKPVHLSDVFTFSTLVLILANLVPVAGALYLGWDLTSILVIYWAESAVVGFYNFCKIIVIGGESSLFHGTFFIVHFGGFMAIHFMFLHQIFISDMKSSTSVNLEHVLILLSALWPALAALFISHGVSFFQNFIGHKEYANRTVAMQMREPYQRIVFMQLVLIIGAALTMLIGDSSSVLLLAIVAKIVVDVMAHIRERSRAITE